MPGLAATTGPRVRLAALTFAALAAACDSPTGPRDGAQPPPPTFGVVSASAALDISGTIQARHVPYGTIISPVFRSSDPASPDYNTIDSYGRAGDAAIWTGHYLAAEAVRYHATGGDAAALENAWGALRAVTSLVDVTGTDVLARFYMPVESPYADAITREEARHTRYTGTLDGDAYYWLGNTSRDQYSGVMFGLAVAYDVVADPDFRDQITSTVTRLLDFLLRNAWSVRMPDGVYSTTFLYRPDQMLSFLQVGRHVNRARFTTPYEAHRAALAPHVVVPIRIECGDTHGSYYKFNLDHINLYNLVRLEEPTSRFRAAYLLAWETLRGPDCTGGHGNAHFNMLDHGVRGAEQARDEETRQLLADWLDRPRRDYPVDVSATYPPACGPDRACTVIPVPERPNTDFLWQRSPYLVRGGGDGTRETAATTISSPTGWRGTPGW